MKLKSRCGLFLGSDFAIDGSDFPASNWAPERVEVANGNLLLGRQGEQSAAISWKDVVQADPDFLIVAPVWF